MLLSELPEHVPPTHRAPQVPGPLLELLGNEIGAQ